MLKTADQAVIPGRVRNHPSAAGDPSTAGAGVTNRVRRHQRVVGPSRGTGESREPRAVVAAEQPGAADRPTMGSRWAPRRASRLPRRAWRATGRGEARSDRRSGRAPLLAHPSAEVPSAGRWGARWQPCCASVRPAHRRRPSARAPVAGASRRAPRPRGQAWTRTRPHAHTPVDVRRPPGPLPRPAGVQRIRTSPVNQLLLADMRGRP